MKLDLECLDRLCLHGYLGQLQVGGQVIQFLNHRGYPVPSPACLQQIGDAFRRRVASFAEANHIPVVTLKAADRNIDVMRPYLEAAAASGRSQVAAIGVAQEAPVFDALVTDNLDLGRPDTIEIIFDRQIRNGQQRATRGTFKTKVITRGVDVTINAFYKHSRIKQYLKDGRTLPVETVVNAPGGLGCRRRLHNLDELQARARAVNARLLHTERAGQACVLANPVFERTARPTVDAEGRRATAMRFGDSRVQALAGALCVTLCAVTGITNRSARPDDRTARRPLRHDPGLLRPGPVAPQRVNHPPPERQHLRPAPDGLAFAIFYTKVHDRVLVPLFTAGQPQAPPQLHAALDTIEQLIDTRLGDARLPAAA